MRLTTHTDYSLRLLIFLGLRPGTPVTIAEVADAYTISPSHLAKVAQSLTKLGFVQTVRGRHGGLRLALPPEAINLGDLVRAIEPDWRLVECFEPAGNACALTPACRLKGVLQQAMGGFFGVLDGVRLSDLLENRLHMQALLRIESRDVVRAAAQSSP